MAERERGAWIKACPTLTQDEAIRAVVARDKLQQRLDRIARLAKIEREHALTNEGLRYFADEIYRLAKGEE